MWAVPGAAASSATAIPDCCETWDLVSGSAILARASAMYCTSISPFRSTTSRGFKGSKSWCKPCKASRLVRKVRGRVRFSPRGRFAPPRIEPQETDAHGEIEHPPPELPGGVPVVRRAGSGDLQRALEGLARRGLDHLKFDRRRTRNGEVFRLQREAAVGFGGGRVRDAAQRHRHGGVPNGRVIHQSTEPNGPPLLPPPPH